MQIVIDIPEEKYNEYKRIGDSRDILFEAIRKGTPLPKGHGDLKDMGNLKYVFDLTRDNPIYSGKDIEQVIKLMTTIIEADNEGVNR